MTDDTLHELALKYALLPSKFGEESDDLWQQMVSGFGEVDTKIAVTEMQEITKLLCPAPFTTVQWYVGLSIINPNDPLIKATSS